MSVSASTAETAVPPDAAMAWGHGPEALEVFMVGARLDLRVLS